MDKTTHIRTYKDQFEPKDWPKFEQLLNKLKTIADNGHDHSGTVRYYARELMTCITLGISATSFTMACILLELYVRQLAIYYVTHHDMPLPEKINPPIENEDFSSNEREMDNLRRNWKFKDIVDQLKDNKFFDISDAETAKDIFNAYRNPLVHGLPSLE